MWSLFIKHRAGALALLLFMLLGTVPAQAQPQVGTERYDSLLALAQSRPPLHDSLRCRYYFGAFLERLVLVANGKPMQAWADDYMAAARRSHSRAHIGGAWLVKAMIFYRDSAGPEPFFEFLGKAQAELAPDSASSRVAGQMAAMHLLRLYYFNHVQQYEGTLKELTLAIEYAQEIKHHGMLSIAYREMALVYGRTGNVPKVKDLYRRAWYHARKARNPILEAAALVNHAEIHRIHHEPDSALLMLDQARRLLSRTKAERMLGVVYLSMGQIYEQQRRYDQLFSAVNTGMQLLKGPYKNAHNANGHMLLAQAWLAKRRLPEADAEIAKGRALARQLHNLDIECKLALLAANVAEARGDYKAALALDRQHRALRDSVDSPGMQRQRNELMQQFEARQRELEIANLRRQNQEEQTKASRQKIYITSISAAALLFLLLLFWVYRINQQLTGTRVRLEENHNIIRKQFERLQQVSQTKDKLFNIIAHDLRGPVTGFQLLPEMIEMAAMTGETPLIIELAKDLKQSSSTLSNLLDRLLTWAQSQNATLAYAPETLFVYTVLGRQRDLYIEAARAKNIEIKVEAEEGLQIYADRNSIETGLRNLLNNAVKFSPAGSQVSLRGYRQGNRAIIEIADQGLGIAPDLLAKLFVPGAAGTSPGTAGEKGVGLGMVLIKELVDHNNGTIDVVSQLGKGTTFRVNLPMGKEVYADPNAQQPNAAVVMNG